jgi:hypothetical protein
MLHPSSVKLTPVRIGKGGHHEYAHTFTLHMGAHEDTVFPIKLGAVYLNKKLKNGLRNKYCSGTLLVNKHNYLQDYPFMQVSDTIKIYGRSQVD